MATGIVFDEPNIPTGQDARDLSIEVDLVAAARGHGVGYVTPDETSIVAPIAKSPDANGRVEFELTRNSDIYPAGTVWRVTYRFGSLIYNTLFFTVASAGPTWIKDVLASPIVPLPDPDFSADYSETSVNETTTFLTPPGEALSAPLTITPTISGPFELVVVCPNASNATATNTSFLSICEGATELVRGFFTSVGAGTQGRIVGSRRFASGEFVPGVHTFEVRKWRLLAGTSTYTGAPGPTITLEVIRR